jgi:hypothetical protein
MPHTSTPQAFSTILSPSDFRDHIAEGIFPSLAPKEVPECCDCRMYLPPVTTEGLKGRSAAAAGACLAEYAARRRTGNKKLMDTGFLHSFRCTNPRQDMHGRDVMRILRKTGVCELGRFRKGKTGWPPTSESVLNRGGENKIQEYARVRTVGGVKEALNRTGPCLITFPVFNTSPRFFLPEGEERPLGGNTVVICGYTSHGFLLRGSWGKKWGSSGYSTYLYEDFGAHWEIWTPIDRDGSDRSGPRGLHAISRGVGVPSNNPPATPIRRGLFPRAMRFLRSAPGGRGVSST